jgi:hypothetical protein
MAAIGVTQIEVTASTRIAATAGRVWELVCDTSPLRRVGGSDGRAVSRRRSGRQGLDV